MKRAGLIVLTRFELGQVNLGAELLVGGRLPFYANVDDAVRDWLPFAKYHGDADMRNQEVLFFLPEFRAYISGTAWSKGALTIEIDGSDARAGTHQAGRGGE